MSPFDPDDPRYDPYDDESDDDLLLHALSHTSAAFHLWARYDRRKGRRRAFAISKLVAWCMDGAVDYIQGRRARTAKPGTTIPSPRPANTSRC